jgi:hypothetical protein
LLDIALVVVEWAIVAFREERLSVLDHLLIQVIKVVTRHDIFDDHQAVSMDVSNCLLQVASIKKTRCDFS